MSWPTEGMAKPRRSRQLVLLALALVALAFWAGTQAGTALVVAEPVESPDAIVSLASHEWERLPATAQLAARYPKAIIVLTLPQEPNEHNCYRCGERVNDLASRGVPGDRVRVVHLISGGTHGEAEAVRDFFQKSSMHNLLIVTSPYHTRRALAVFRHAFAGAPVTIGIAPATVTPQARPSRWWMAGYDRWYVSYEWSATAYYAVRYGIRPW
jgi:uncharacterized SAM-binding protein YcdF (DUF218 family)